MLRICKLVTLFWNSMLSINTHAHYLLHKYEQGFLEKNLILVKLARK